jgi:hypothetical protein
MRAGAITVAVIVILFGGLAYLELSPDQEPLPTSLPALPAVSGCRQPVPGMRRIGEQTGLQFDVPIRDFTISEGSTDAPPPIHGFDIKPKNITAWLSISWGEEITQTRRSGMPLIRFSIHRTLVRPTILGDGGYLTIRGKRSVKSPGDIGDKASTGGASICSDGFTSVMALKTKGTFAATAQFTSGTPHSLTRS